MNTRNIIIKTLSTFFYVGYLPFIPGTFGSMAGILLFYFIRNSPLAYALTTLFLIILGFLVSGEAEKILNKKDPRCIVIDEVCGMLLALMFVPYDIRLIVIAFVLFRILDSLKPFPAGRLQDLKGGPGVMLDDIVAGLYTNLILQALLRLAVFKVS
ncbi:MAG: phosphatidylglycerophosphatase A [Candidatus Omnitrophota bacterium]